MHSRCTLNAHDDAPTGDTLIRSSDPFRSRIRLMTPQYCHPAVSGPLKIVVTVVVTAYGAGDLTPRGDTNRTPGGLAWDKFQNGRPISGSKSAELECDHGRIVGGCSSFHGNTLLRGRRAAPVRTVLAAPGPQRAGTRDLRIKVRLYSKWVL
ncbi:hypothetical protein EVAR_973_1 [Eumeta japonica]|uniref:Uncharacterized protein n=1 Tax=Eumeta variegata TaxID=151549 RepID=A0A4C1SE37_EUMVA|nr:hypothetical protein EVAR_973_1 [Eumeta japonica]